MVYILTADAAGSTISGGRLYHPAGTALITAAANRKVTLSGDAVINGNVDSYGVVNVEGGTIDGNVTSNPKSIVTISGGSVIGNLRKLASAESTGILTVTGGAFCSDPMEFIPLDDAISVDNIERGVLNYQVSKGFVKDGDIIDFGSSLNVSLKLVATNGYELTDHYDEFEISCGKYNDIVETITMAGTDITVDVLTIQASPPRRCMMRSILWSAKTV